MDDIERRAYEAIGITPPKEGQMAVAGWMHTTFELNCFKNGYIKGAKEQNDIIRNALIERQGEYISIELIKEIFEEYDND